MKRGEIWTVLGSSYAGKPRPVLVVQSDEVGPFDSTILCLITSYDSSKLSTRVQIQPSAKNGLQKTSWVMTDKIYSARKSELGEKIGVLEEETMEEVSRQLAVTLGL